MTATAAKIITVTANTAIDYVIEVNQLSLGDNVIAENTLKFAAGKGINVGKAIASLCCPVHILGFVGAKSQNLFQEFNYSEITADFCFVAGETRTNITLFDSSKKQETHIRTAGFSVTRSDCQNLFDKLSACINQNDIVVFSGSLPNHAPLNFYEQLIFLCQQKKAITFLDSSGESLQAGLKAKPYLIKPNLTEFESLMGRSLTTEAAIVEAAREIIETGVECVVVSRAKQGALFITEDLVLAALVDAQDEEIISSVGCGDALDAGLAVAKLRGYNIEQSLKLAVACGAANLFSPEPGVFQADKLAQIITKVQIRVL
jgi:1-phosphofructokinase family hexose kinase